MSIAPGTKLGHYEISTLLGKGGMGEVWRARDTKLGREVAIKTLPEEEFAMVQAAGYQSWWTVRLLVPSALVDRNSKMNARKPVSARFLTSRLVSSPNIKAGHFNISARP